jgi:hypothetical protein
MGGVGLQVLDVLFFVEGNRWQGMVSFTLQLLYCMGRTSNTHFRVGCVGANSRSGRSAKNCNLRTFRDLNPVSRLSRLNSSQYNDSTFNLY